MIAFYVICCPAVTIEHRLIDTPISRFEGGISAILSVGLQSANVHGHKKYDWFRNLKAHNLSIWLDFSRQSYF